MKLASLLFVAPLFYVHQVCSPYEALDWRLRGTPANRSLMLMHLCAPIVLAVVTGFESYGIWHKALITYFVVVGTIHHQ